MTITTLKASPHLRNETIELIEKSFHYDPQNKFDIDFAPLMDESNHHNCFIMLSEDGKVCAHIGVCERSIGEFQVALLGGIAVAEEHRGGGKFQELMMEVMSEKKSDVAFFVLWSDKEKLYQKYGFQLCGSQYEISAANKTETTFEKTKYAHLSAEEKESLQELYRTNFEKFFFTISRTPDNWETIGKISSTDLFVKKHGNQIEAYYFKSKGQDLSDIVFEYGSTKSFLPFLRELSTSERVWSPVSINEADEEHYQFMLCPGSTRIFSQFCERYTNGKIVVREVSSVKQEVYFQFEEELLGLDMIEFLRGVFGPQPFEELGEIRPLFFSGLDSI